MKNCNLFISELILRQISKYSLSFVLEGDKNHYALEVSSFIVLRGGKWGVIMIPM